MFKILRFFFGPPPMSFTVKKMRSTVLISAYKFWENEEVRKSINFNEIEQEEQDRIYNEIMATALVGAILLFEAMEKTPKNEKFSDKIGDLRVEFKQHYIDYLSGLNLSQEKVEMWGQLIDMRLEEYKRHMAQYRKYLVEDMEWFQVVATGGLHHIRRGKPQGKDDPLFKLLRTWLKIMSEDVVKLVNELI